MSFRSWIPTFCLMSAFQLIQGQTLSSTYPMKVSMGAFVTEVKGPIFYETFVPLIYEYQVPTYKAVDITLRDWRSKCENDAYVPSYTCPVFYHFERFLERFEDEVVPKAWMDRKTNRTTAPSPMTDGDDFCNKIQPHFKGKITQEFGFEEYVEKLKRCNQGVGNNLIIERQISDYVFDIKALFKKMNDNYETEFSNKFFGETNKKIGPAFYVNAVTSHQNGMLIAYLLEKQRWTSAISACNEQRVPETLLRPNNVTKNLNGLNGRLGIADQHAAVSIEEISSIFKLPLADCSFIERTGHFVVRILIPVISKSATPQLYRVNTVPFFLKNKICQLNLNARNFLYEESTKNMQLTECAGGEDLCQVKDFQDTLTDMCVRAVFAKDHFAAKRYCGDSFSCVDMIAPKGKLDSALMKFPMVKQIYSDAWVVLGTGPAVKDKMTIKCEGSTEEVKVNLTEDMTGGLEIRLPCRCHMVFNSELLYPIKPCSQDYSQPPEIHQILPPQFLKEEALSNPNTNITLNSFDPNFLEDTKDGQKPSAQTQQPDGTKIEPVHNVSSQLGILWTLVILQLVLTLSIISLGLYKYAQYRKEMSYSKERLVYNIYASPSDHNISESSSNGGAYRVTTTSTTPTSECRNY